MTAANSTALLLLSNTAPLPLNNTELLLLSSTELLLLSSTALLPSSTVHLLLSSNTALLPLNPPISLRPIALLCPTVGLLSSTRTSSDGTMLRQPLAALSGRLLVRHLPLLPRILVLLTSLNPLTDLVVTLVLLVDMVLQLLAATVVLLAMAATLLLLLVRVVTDLLLQAMVPPRLMALLLPMALPLLTEPPVNTELPLMVIAATTPTVKARRRRAVALECFSVPQVVSPLVLSAVP